MSEIVVTDADDLKEGEHVIIEIKGREIAVFNMDGEYYAYLNWCAHQGGPICEGQVTGRFEATFDREKLETEERWMGENSTLICPWHDWEFDLETGEGLSKDCELPSYPVRIEDGKIIVSL